MVFIIQIDCRLKRFPNGQSLTERMVNFSSEFLLDFVLHIEQFLPKNSDQ